MSRAPAGKRPASMARPQVPVRVPLAPRTVWRWMLIGGGSLLGVGALVWAMALGVPQRAVAEAAVMGSAAGFTVRQVEIEGTEQQPRLDIYQELLRGGTDSMFGLDVAAARARLISLPWVADARVERRWPDRLRVEIYEKHPVAIWQLNGALQVVDAAGNPLPVGNLADFKELPLVIGVGANAQLADLQRLSARAPALFKALEAAHWVGGRRWDLKMKSGETVSLPQGPDARLAIEKLAAIDRATPLLGRGFVRLDLRIPDKLVVRVSGETGAVARPKPAPARPPVAAPQAAVETPMNGARPDAGPEPAKPSQARMVT